MPDAHYVFVGNDGPTFYFSTDRDAARGRLVAIDTTQDAGKPPALREIIPQADETLEGVSYVGGSFVADYLKDAHTQVKVFGTDGKLLHEVKLPGLGTATGFNGKPKDEETFFSFTTYTRPSTIFRYDVKTDAASAVFAPKVAFDPAQYTSEQVFYHSKDGTRVPMIISYKKGMERNGQNPTVLYGYGGFDISLTPAFSPANLAWMEMGGIYAVPNLRGGGEYGEEWHLAGTKERKQNVFDDFIAAAEYLIAEKYTSTPKLAISGRSNGGLLIGAAMTPAARPVRRGAARRGRDGHAAFPEVHHRLGLGVGLRHVGRRGAVQVAVRVFAAAPPEAGRALSGDAGDDERPRRPRGAGAFVQVRGDLAGRPGGGRADVDPHRDQERPRRRTARPRSSSTRPPTTGRSSPTCSAWTRSKWRRREIARVLEQPRASPAVVSPRGAKAPGQGTRKSLPV